MSMALPPGHPHLLPVLAPDTEAIPELARGHFLHLPSDTTTFSTSLYLRGGFSFLAPAGRPLLTASLIWIESPVFTGCLKDTR